MRAMLRLASIASLAAAALAVGGCETGFGGYGGGYGYPSYGGGYYGAVGIGGAGARKLDPWLSGTSVGRRLVLTRFDRNFNGAIGSERAYEANDWFRRFADRDRDLVLTDLEIKQGLARAARGLR